MSINSKFYDDNYLILEECYNENISKLKVAIHIHIYYIDMIYIFIRNLIKFPILFDLFITVNSKENKEICLKHFNKKDIAKLNDIKIIIVDNIGRDIAPWIIELSDIQNDYDLFCHLHTKKSTYNKTLENWGEYLIENLLNENAVKTILTLFLLNDNITMIFPPIYYFVFPYIKEMDKNDEKNINELLNRLKIEFKPTASNFIFPTGSMLWYRPNALKPLFNLNFQYNDFPKEPIPTTGTLAHAIERVIGILGEQNNYKIKLFINRKSLIENLYNLYKLIENIKNNLNNNDINKIYEILNTCNFNKKNKIISILEIKNFSLLKIETGHKKIIFTLFGITITIKVGFLYKCQKN